MSIRGAGWGTAAGHGVRAQERLLAAPSAPFPWHPGRHRPWGQTPRLEPRDRVVAGFRERSDPVPPSGSRWATPALLFQHPAGQFPCAYLIPLAFHTSITKVSVVGDDAVSVLPKNGDLPKSPFSVKAALLPSVGAKNFEKLNCLWRCFDTPCCASVRCLQRTYRRFLIIDCEDVMPKYLSICAALIVLGTGSLPLLLVTGVVLSAGPANPGSDT
jgi:hypothetical protein